MIISVLIFIMITEDIFDVNYFHKKLQTVLAHLIHSQIANGSNQYSVVSTQSQQAKIPFIDVIVIFFLFLVKRVFISPYEVFFPLKIFAFGTVHTEIYRPSILIFCSQSGVFIIA